MSNYTSENLVEISPQNVPAGTLAMKVGNDFFMAGNVRISSDVQLGQIIEKDGVQKFVPMVFDGTEASEGTAETFTELYTYNTVNPTPEVSGGGTDFYKCASVDTVNQTWTGYKLLEQDNGGYTVSNDLTENLSYIKTAPIVDKIYSENCSLHVGSYIPSGSIDISDDYIFYDPMTSIASGDSIGTSITQSGTSVQLDSQLSMNVLNFVSSNTCRYLTGSLSNISVWTYSMWVKRTVSEGSGMILAISWDTMIYLSDSNIDIVNWDGSKGNNVTIPFQPNLIWHNIVIIRSSNSSAKVYVDGILLYNSSCPWRDNLSTIAIGYHRYNNQSSLNAYVSSVRLYNRVLDEDEILALANEFTPANS